MLIRRNSGAGGRAGSRAGTRTRAMSGVCADAHGAMRGISCAVGVALDGGGILGGTAPLIVVDRNRMSGGAAAGRTTSAGFPRSRSSRLHAHASV